MHYHRGTPKFAMTTSSSDTANEPVKQEWAPTCYKVHSRETFQRSWLWPVTIVIVPILSVATDAAIFDFFVIYEKVQESLCLKYSGDDCSGAASAVITGLSVALLCALLHRLYSTRIQTRDVDLSVNICPLGVQRSKTTTVTYNHNVDHKKVRVHHYPLLPIEAIESCFLLEHVGAFSVTTHVMIRMAADISEDSNPFEVSSSSTVNETEKVNNKSKLVSAFPDAKLTFIECHDLAIQIRKALEEVR